MNFKKIGFPQINYAPEGDPPSGGGAAGTIANPGAGPGAGAAFAWPADLEGPIVETLKSKGFYDDPVKGALGLAKSYTELNRLHSGAADVLALPKADAPPEAWDKFYGKLRPETPDKYEVKLKAGVQEMPEGDINFAKKLAHKWGVPVAKINEGIHMWQDFRTEETAKMSVDLKAKSDAAVAQIKTTMGEEKFNASVANAQKAFKIMAAQNLISSETLAALEQTVGAKPVIELMAALGQRMGGEGSIITGVQTPPPSDPTQMTPEQAKAEITRLNADPEFQKVYWDAKHPDKPNAVARMAALFAAQHRNVR